MFAFSIYLRTLKTLLTTLKCSYIRREQEISTISAIRDFSKEELKEA